MEQTRTRPVMRPETTRVTQWIIKQCNGGSLIGSQFIMYVVPNCTGIKSENIIQSYLSLQLFFSMT